VSKIESNESKIESNESKIESNESKIESNESAWHKECQKDEGQTRKILTNVREWLVGFRPTVIFIFGATP
jgi:hypothetical protein